MRIDFAKYSSVKIGGVLDVEQITPNQSFDGIVIGGANNLLISPDFSGKLGILSDEFNYIKCENGLLKIGAKTSSKDIYKFAKNNDISGFEALGQIPGFLGGLIKMNAGLKGLSISDNLINLNCAGKSLSKNECAFAYRKSEISGVIFEASFELKHGFNDALSKNLRLARLNQPSGASFGSIFKNPSNDSAGRLIEAAGLKGHKIGACELSKKHANFLINHGNASFNDALILINLAKKRVFECFGICLEEEVVVLY